MESEFPDIQKLCKNELLILSKELSDRFHFLMEPVIIERLSIQMPSNACSLIELTGTSREQFESFGFRILETIANFQIKIFDLKLESKMDTN